MTTPPSAVTATVSATRARRGLVLVGQALVLATLLLAGVAALAGSPGGGASSRRPAPRRALLFSLSGGRAAHRTLVGAVGEQKRDASARDTRHQSFAWPPPPVLPTSERDID